MWENICNIYGRISVNIFKYEKFLLVKKEMKGKIILYESWIKDKSRLFIEMEM